MGFGLIDDYYDVQPCVILQQIDDLTKELIQKYNLSYIEQRLSKFIIYKPFFQVIVNREYINKVVILDNIMYDGDYKLIFDKNKMNDLKGFAKEMNSQMIWCKFINSRYLQEDYSKLFLRTELTEEDHRMIDIIDESKKVMHVK